MRISKMMSGFWWPGLPRLCLLSVVAYGAVRLFETGEPRFLVLIPAALAWIVFMRFYGSIKRACEALILAALFIKIDMQIGWSIQDPYRHPGIPITLTLLALVPLYVLWIRDEKTRLLRPPKVRIPWLIILPGAMLVIMAVGSIAWAQQVMPLLQSLVYLFQGLLVFWYFANRVITPDDTRFYVRCIASAVLITSVVAVLQHLFPTAVDLNFIRGSEPLNETVGSIALHRVTGLSRTPNELARSLAIWLPTLILFGLAGPKRAYAAAATLLGTLALLLTYSRGGFLSLAGALGVVALVVVARSDFRLHVRSAYLRTAGLAMIAVLVTSPFIPNLYARFTTEDQGQVAVRVQMNDTAMRLIRAHPAGVGLSNYRFFMPDYDSSNVSETFPYPVHNLYLLLAGELGIPAVAAFAVLTVALARHALRRSAILNRESVLLVLGSLLAIIAFVLDGFAEGDCLGSPMILHYCIAAGFVVSFRQPWMHATARIRRPTVTKAIGSQPDAIWPQSNASADGRSAFSLAD